MISKHSLRQNGLLRHNNEGMHPLSPLFIWYSDDSASDRIWMLADGIFYLSTENVFAPGNDHVLQAVDDPNISVCVHYTNITGMKPTIFHSLLGNLRLFPIPLHNRRSPDKHFTSHPGTSRFPGFVCYADFAGHICAAGRIQFSR